MSLELYGHNLDVSEEEIKRTMLRRRDERQRFTGLPPSGDTDPLAVEECQQCGRSLRFVFGPDESPVLVAQAPSVTDYHAGVREPHPADAPCPVAGVSTVVVPFTCRSGRIALGNDFLRHFPSYLSIRYTGTLNYRAGEIAHIHERASDGYLTGFLLTTAMIYFIPRADGLDVVCWAEVEDDVLLPEQAQADKRAAVHRVRASLWRFAIVDAADLPSGASDVYDRPAGFMDLPPGDYELTYGFHTEGEVRHPLAELRRKASAVAQ